MDQHLWALLFIQLVMLLKTLTGLGSSICPARNTENYQSVFMVVGESTIGLFKTEVINFLGRWKSVA